MCSLTRRKKKNPAGVSRSGFRLKVRYAKIFGVIVGIKPTPPRSQHGMLSLHDDHHGTFQFLTAARCIVHRPLVIEPRVAKTPNDKRRGGNPKFS
jgi:hypothetical protein